VDLAGALAPGGPEAGRGEPLAEGLPANPEVVELEELLMGQGGPEVGVVLADDGHGALAELARKPVVARAASLKRHQPRGPMLCEPHAEPVHLARAEPEQLASLRLRQPAIQDSPNHVDTIDLSRAHRDQLQGHGVAPGAGPSRAGPTFQLGWNRTFLRGCYTPESDNVHYVN